MLGWETTLSREGNRCLHPPQQRSFKERRLKVEIAYASYGISMGLFVVIIITIQVVLIGIKVAMIAMLIKALLIVMLMSLCYSLWRCEMPKPVICTWCGCGVAVNSRETVFLRITKLEYYFDSAECLVRWLYSRSIIKLEAGERLPGVPLLPQEDG